MVPLVRIGELSERVGITPDVLRAWERRYGLLSPARTTGGLRLYSPDDEQRVRDMQDHVASGVSPAEAARAVLVQSEPPNRPPELAAGARELAAALDALDDAQAQRALDQLLLHHPLDDVLAHAILPYLKELGEQWLRGEASIAREHFASNVIRGRLLTLSRGWDVGSGPRAVLACAPEELHELGIIALGLVLRSHDWRITYLGPDVSIATLETIYPTISPDAVVVVSTSEDRIKRVAGQLALFARAKPLFLAGPGASQELASQTGASLLTGDPIAAAAQLDRSARAASRRAS